MINSLSNSPVDHQADEHGRQDYVPEPNEDVRLLVDNIQGQDAERVVLLNSARGSVLVKDALGHPREDVDHRIDPTLLWRLREIHHSPAVGQELAIEELVHEDQLHDYVNQAEELADKVPNHVGAM